MAQTAGTLLFMLFLLLPNTLWLRPLCRPQIGLIESQNFFPGLCFSGSFSPEMRCTWHPHSEPGDAEFRPSVTVLLLFSLQYLCPCVFLWTLILSMPLLSRHQCINGPILKMLLWFVLCLVNLCCISFIAFLFSQPSLNVFSLCDLLLKCGTLNVTYCPD